MYACMYVCMYARERQPSPLRSIFGDKFLQFYTLSPLKLGAAQYTCNAVYALSRHELFPKLREV